jgi:hypothetical protein
MSTSSQPTVEAPPGRRPFVRLALILFALLALGVGALGYLWYARDRAIREAVAEADRLDPRWRLAGLEAARPAVPDAENAALQVTAAYVLLPPGTGAPGLDDEIDRLEPPARLGASLRKELGWELGKAAPALPQARRLAEMSRGRYAVTWSPDAVGTPMRHLDQLRPVAVLLRLDAVRRADDGDAAGALKSCRAVLNAGRSVGDEPALVSQLVRLSCQRLAVKGLERALAQGEAPEADLAAVQRALEEEEKEPLQLIGARGERATVHQFLEVMEADGFDYATYNMKSATGSRQLDGLLDAGKARSTHATYLRYLTELVEIAKLPPEQQAERRRRPGLEPPQGVPRILEALTERGTDFGPKFGTARGLLRCAAAAVAAERYRKAHGRWPDRLEALVPDYLAAVPADPSDGQPLLYRHTPDGVEVEAPAATAESPGPRSTPADAIAFRLWDVEHRHQPR